MSYQRDAVKQITDRVLNMCKADAVEVRFSGGERSATRFANSSITANLVEHDQEVQITVYYGQKTATATTHQFDDASLQAGDRRGAGAGPPQADNPELMLPVAPPQAYVEVDGALPAAVDFGPAERAQDGQGEHRHLREEGRARRRLHPQVPLDRRDCQLGRAVRLPPLRGRQLHPHLPHAGSDRVGLGGTTGAKDIAANRCRGVDRSCGGQGVEVA